jgi:hypothetical protein
LDVMVEKSISTKRVLFSEKSAGWILNIFRSWILGITSVKCRFRVIVLFDQIFQSQATNTTRICSNENVTSLLMIILLENQQCR